MFHGFKKSLIVSQDEEGCFYPEYDFIWEKFESILGILRCILSLYNSIADI